MFLTYICLNLLRKTKQNFSRVEMNEYQNIKVVKIPRTYYCLILLPMFIEIKKD